MSLFARRRGRPEPPPAASGQAAPSPTAATVELCGERLPSRVPSVFFIVHIDGSWYVEGAGSEEPYGDPAVRARSQLRERAGQTLTHYTVLERAAAQDAVNQAIARPLNPVTGFTASGIAELFVDDGDRSLALEHLRREQEGDLQRHDAHRHLVFLQRVFADPDLRRVWWIDQHPDRIGDLSALKAALEDLRAPHDSDRDTLRDEIGRFIDQLLDDFRSPEQREVLLRALTQTLRTLGSSDLQKTAASWLHAHPTSPGDGTA
ncbi:hypothetical protein ACFXGT_18235 [Streptomyces sp. NPDC059352]|uniref:hypothetical protein n=1 Tax=Streptomyces sp. NPDC059352 TaxID=3346810 RepID=UPI0036D13CB8